MYRLCLKTSQLKQASGSRFFTGPAEARDSCRRSPDNAWGYFDDELTKQKLDLKLGFDFGHVANTGVPEDSDGNRQRP